MSEVISPELLLEMQRIAFFMVFVILVVWAAFAYTIRNTLRLIAQENRSIEPKHAWLLVIPLFNVYWNFEVARRLSNSLNNEFFDRKIAVDDNPGLGIGLTYAWSFLIFYFPFPVFWKLLAMIVSFVYFVSYWYKINQFKELLMEHNKFLESEEIKDKSNEN